MKLLLPVIIVLLVLGGFFVVNQYLDSRSDLKSQYPSSIPTTELKAFQSEVLDFSIDTPSSFNIKESTTAVDAIGKEGKIEIVRNGTQFTNLNEYLIDFDEKRKIVVQESEEKVINNNSAARRVESRIVGGEEKTPLAYYIYVNNAVYILSTNSESLYDELDQIAQSFRYTP